MKIPELCKLAFVPTGKKVCTHTENEFLSGRQQALCFRLGTYTHMHYNYTGNAELNLFSSDLFVYVYLYRDMNMT